MQVTITLTEIGIDIGPTFSLTANIGVVTPSEATKTELQNGKSVTIDDTATMVTITSIGICTSSVDVNLIFDCSLDGTAIFDVDTMDACVDCGLYLS